MLLVQAPFNSSATARGLALASPASRSNPAFEGAGLGPFSLWSSPEAVNAPAPPPPLPLPPRLARCSTAAADAGNGSAACAVTASSVTLEWDAPSLEALGGLPLA